MNTTGFLQTARFAGKMRVPRDRYFFVFRAGAVEGVEELPGFLAEGFAEVGVEEFPDGWALVRAPEGLSAVVAEQPGRCVAGRCYSRGRS